MSTSEDRQDTYTDLTARLAAADLGWSHEHGDPPANPDYIRWLAFQVMAFKPPLIAGVYVDDEMLDDMRDRLHGDNCGCGEWDSHSQEYVERMDETIHAVLYPLRHPARPVPQGTEGSDYRERIARALLASSDSRTDLSGTHDIQIIPADAAADLYERFVSPLVEQLRRARAAYNRMAAHAVDRAAERDRYYLAWQSAARGRRQARQQWQTWQREAEQWQAETVESAKATQGLRAELDAVGRAIECFLGVEYGTPVGSARALVERCADAECALDGLRATAVVLPEDWRQMLADGDYPEQVVDLIESWRAAPVVEFEAADSPSPVSKSSQTAAPAEAETPARPIGMVYLLNQYDRLLSAVEHIRMDTPEDRDRHARVIATFRRAAEPVREQVEGAALPEVEITDEHVREHDDAAPTRDEVVEEWADAWDGDDRTPEWVRVVEPCPVSDCTIPQVHGHAGYGLRFTPAASAGAGTEAGE